MTGKAGETENPDGLSVVPVMTARQLDRFIKLPNRLQAGDPHYVAPLVLDRRDAFSAKKNPYFQHAEARFWLACRDGRDVGRISAQVDRLQKDPAFGQFGLIAAEDDPAIFRTLFETAEGWLRERGRTRVQGPFNLSINEESGLLVDGFDTPPMMLMGHDAPYVGARVEEQGYAKAKDLLAYVYDVAHDLPSTARKLIDRPLPAELKVRSIDMRNYKAEVARIVQVYNDAWSGNWGFVPFTDEEAAHMASSMRPLLDPELCVVVEWRGEMVAFGLTLPNLNEAIAGFKGRLLPFNLFKLLWRLKVRGVKSGRTLLMGVCREFATSGLAGSMTPFLIIDRMRKRARELGMQRGELSWILEDNAAMCRINESLGGTAYKTYRVYEKKLV